MNAKEAIFLLEKLPPETEVILQIGVKSQDQLCETPVDNGLVNAAVAGMIAGSIAGSM